MSVLSTVHVVRPGLGLPLEVPSAETMVFSAADVGRPRATE